jgi:hypothetical protein
MATVVNKLKQHITPQETYSNVSCSLYYFSQEAVFNFGGGGRKYRRNHWEGGHMKKGSRKRGKCEKRREKKNK